jgi:hypothetical protein
MSGISCGVSGVQNRPYQSQSNDNQVGGIDVHQLVLPVAKRKEALVLAHDTLWGGHLGAKKCLQRIKMSFWWPTICEDVRAWCGSCKDCQLRKRVTRLDRVPISAVVRPDETFEVMNCDAIGPFEQRSTRGHSYVLVLVDQCSRWVEAIPLRSLTAKAACDAMLEVFARTGIPKVLISDNGQTSLQSLLRNFESD